MIITAPAHAHERKAVARIQRAKEHSPFASYRVYCSYPSDENNARARIAADRTVFELQKRDGIATANGTPHRRTVTGTAIHSHLNTREHKREHKREHER